MIQTVANVAWVVGYAALLAATIAACRIVPNHLARRRRAGFAVGDTLVVRFRRSSPRVTVLVLDPTDLPIDSQFAEVQWPDGWINNVPVRLLRKPRAGR